MDTYEKNPTISAAELTHRFCSLSVYRNLLEDKVISSLYSLVQSLQEGAPGFAAFLNRYSSFFHTLISTSDASLREYLIEKILYTENPFAEAIEKGSDHRLFGSIEAAAAHDLGNLNTISGISSVQIKALAKELFTSVDRNLTETIEALPTWDLDLPRNSTANGSGNFEAVKNAFAATDMWSDLTALLKEFHAAYGSGIFSQYSAFLWERQGDAGFLRGVPAPDPVLLSDLIGYEEERKAVIDNTLHFLDGFKANNVLLYGDRGSGKSSTVKGLLNEYHQRGLRLIEVPKSFLVDFPRVTALLRHKKQKFIIFVDDLAFEDNEENYTALKAILEGGVESKPDNVLIYATSNRRHLVKEKFSDRAGLHSGNAEDEIRASDSIQEKLSLADRFGITVVFSSPDKKRYLQIVEGLVAQRGLDIDKEKLHREALKWELWYNGRSPRTARQFVDWLEGEMGVQEP